MKCQRENDARKLDHGTLQAMRIRAVSAVRKGQPVEQVAEVFGLHKRTVFRWVAMFLAGGQKALQAKPIPGRLPKLNAQQLAWLAQALRKHPKQYEFPFALWTLAMVRDLIARRFAQEVSLMTIRKMLRSLGFSVQRPTYRAWQQNAALVARWEQEDYPALQALARKTGVKKQVSRQIPRARTTSSSSSYPRSAACKSSPTSLPASSVIPPASLRHQLMAPSCGQSYEPKMPVEVREWIGSVPGSS